MEINHDSLCYIGTDTYPVLTVVWEVPFYVEFSVGFREEYSPPTRSLLHKILGDDIDFAEISCKARFKSEPGIFFVTSDNFIVDRAPEVINCKFQYFDEFKCKYS